MIEWLFAGNPLEEKHSAEGNWRDEAIKRLPHLKKLDGKNFLIFNMGLVLQLPSAVLLYSEIGHSWAD